MSENSNPQGDVNVLRQRHVPLHPTQTIDTPTDKVDPQIKEENSSNLEAQREVLTKEQNDEIPQTIESNTVGQLSELPQMKEPSKVELPKNEEPTGLIPEANPILEHRNDEFRKEEPRLRSFSEAADRRKEKPHLPDFLSAFKVFYFGRAKKFNQQSTKLQNEIKEKGIRTAVANLNHDFQQNLQEKLMKVPILKNKDKVTFVLGIALLMVTEYIMIAQPQSLWILYISLLFPLMILRFLTYHKNNFHYFMLDFCYYMQLWTLIVLFAFPKDISLFKVYFGLSNGPLIMATVMWKNKLVFHDLDKITSLFIHMFPSLLTYTIRWHTDLFTNVSANDERIHLFEIGYMLLFYVLWQVLYVLKTEYLDGVKFANDATLMSSARWLSSVQPHPLYSKVLKRGWKVTPNQILVPFQLVYTLLTFIPAFFYVSISSSAFNVNGGNIWCICMVWSLLLF